YVVKPFDPPKLIALVESALRTQADIRSAGGVQPVLNPEDHKEGIVGTSAAMQQVFKVIGQVAASDVTVMITGESGTGKELVAKAVHANSKRASRPFVTVNCAAISETLLESELFGHEKGAFTGAVADRVGRFQQADKGTLFLDEVGDMPLALQAKILRALQERVIEPVGDPRERKVD
ncbi:sigma-54 factor interaction domain-containing protein, partial [Pantoea sp. ANP04]|uniref:sigma-54 factor interaction domain-containing protein n=1 Tax=Pantoea sp. ANP04 TaxID=3064896 RepID=UPI0035C58CBB